MASETGKTNILSWAAIGISVLSLIVALIALNPPIGIRPADTVENVQTQVRSLQQEIELNRARQRLEDIRQRITTGGSEANEQAQQEIAEIRGDLRKNFENAKDSTKQSWQTLDQQLEEVETNLKQGGINILDAVDKAINTLKQTANTINR